MTRMMLIATLALAFVGCREEKSAPPTTPPARPAPPGPRITMADLHRTGGVPPGWRFTLPPGDVAAGARAFVDLGCDACHHVAGVSSSAADERRGPDLTGMGSHHPAEYFVESITTPDAVLVDGPGWIGPDGRSTMPAYPDVTLRQLADLVAYLQSLRAGGAAEMMAAVMAKVPGDVPPAPPGTATIYYVQVYDVLAGTLGKFEAWFRDEGGAAFLAHDGLVAVDTWVDVSRDGPALTTVLGFRDNAALKRFLDDPTTDALGRKFDEFIGPHTHRVYRQLPVYRAASLSTP